MDKIDIKNLRYLVESSPTKLLSCIDAVYAQESNAANKPTLLLYKAMALVAVKDFTQAAAIAEDLLNPAMDGNDRYLLCMVYVVLGKCNPSLTSWQKHYLELAYESARESDDNDLIGEMLNHLAGYYITENESAKALKYLSMAVELVKSGSNHFLLETILLDTATTYYRAQQYDRAIDSLCQALEQNEYTSNPDRKLVIMCNLAVIYQDLKRYQDAQVLLLDALQVADICKNTGRKVIVLSKLGSAYLGIHDYDESKKYMLQCLEFCRATGFTDPEFFFELYSNLAGLLRLMDNPEECLIYLDKAVEYATLLNNDDYTISTTLNRANLLSYMGKYKEAEKLLKKVITFCRKHKFYDNLISAQTFLAGMYEFQGDSTKSIRHYKELIDTFHQYISEVHSAQIEEYKKKIADYVKVATPFMGTPSGCIERDAHRLKSTFIGNSPAVRQVLNQIRMAASHPNTSVMITGESGTGKEIVAHLVHRQSSRSQYPLVAINTAAITASLLESELFGYKKGAYTGAYSDSQGIFERAQHGTVFLDEIAEMPYELQVKLLRTLETRKILPVGGKSEQAFDCRIISSTNRDVKAMVAQNSFRLDLLHRLNTFVIHIPPLRERQEDIPLLIDHYAAAFASEMKVPPPIIKRTFYNGLRGYAFPGNVRELINIIERLMIMNPGSEWGNEQLEQLNIASPPQSRTTSGLKDKFLKAERQEIIEALQKAGGKQKTAAKMLGISESTLTRRIIKFDLGMYTIRGN